MVDSVFNVDNSLGIVNYMPLLHSLFSFNGRISRQPYWLFTLATAVILFGPAIFYFGVGSDKADTYVDIAALVLFWPAIALQTKRWHDRDKSAWWLLINFVPVLGLFWALIENGFLQGTIGGNRFGEDPLSTCNEA